MNDDSIARRYIHETIIHKSLMNEREQRATKNRKKIEPGILGHLKNPINLITRK